MAEKISKTVKSLSNDEIAALLMLAALLFGIWLRLAPAIESGFPMNDGGMFYSMIRDLRQNGYTLPAFTSYNKLDIPFVYSPLPFYLAGGLADLLHLSDLAVLIWLPALVNILTLPAFVLLAGTLLDSRLKTALATFFYALMPLSMDWFLMGGGLTRGLGQLFMILTIWGAYRVFINRTRMAMIGTILSGALVVLCHPESALLTVTSVVIIWLFSVNKQKNLLNAALICIGISFLCLPWFIFVLRLHGLGPFIQAIQTNGSSLFMWAAIFPFNFTQESGLALLAMLGLIGFFLKLGQKDYLLPAWVVIPFFVNPRSSARVAILPLAMLAATSLLEVILPAILSTPNTENKARRLAGNLLLGYILVYLLAGGFSLDQRMIANHLGEGDRQAMDWVRQNTPVSSKFIILSGESALMRDPVQEWFPALAERRSQTTLQGWEWLDESKFNRAMAGYQGLINCYQQDETCLSTQTGKLGISFDHIYISKLARLKIDEYSTQGLVAALDKTPKYHKIFENDSVVIYNIYE